MKRILIILLVLGGGLSGALFILSMANENHWGEDTSNQHSNGLVGLYLFSFYSIVGFVVGSLVVFFVYKLLKPLPTKARYFLYGMIIVFIVAYVMAATN